MSEGSPNPYQYETNFAEQNPENNLEENSEPDPNMLSGKDREMLAIKKDTKKEISREEQSQKTLRFLDKLHANEYFGDEESTREFINTISFEEFVNLLTATNSMLRDIPLSQRSADGENVYLADQGFGINDEYFPPQYSDKIPLFKETFDNVKKMNLEGRSLEDIALLVGLIINAIHLFNDGNGRTSRLTYALIKKGYNQSPEQTKYYSKILGEDGRYTLDVNPGTIGYCIEDELHESLDLRREPTCPIGFWDERNGNLTEKNLEEYLEQSTLSDESKKTIRTLVYTDKNFGFPALYQFLNSKDLVEQYSKTFYREEKPLRTWLLIHPIIKDLTDEDVSVIAQNYHELKRQYVRQLADSIVNPDNHLESRSNGQQERLLDILKSKTEKIDPLD